MDRLYGRPFWVKRNVFSQDFKMTGHEIVYFKKTSAWSDTVEMVFVPDNCGTMARYTLRNARVVPQGDHLTVQLDRTVVLRFKRMDTLPKQVFQFLKRNGWI